MKPSQEHGSDCGCAICANACRGHVFRNPGANFGMNKCEYCGVTWREWQEHLLAGLRDHYQR